MRSRKRKPEQPTSKYIGVSWNNVSEKFCAQIKFKGRTTYLGLYPSEEMAAIVYDNEVYRIEQSITDEIELSNFKYRHTYNFGHPADPATQNRRDQACQDQHLIVKNVKFSKRNGINNVRITGITWYQARSHWKVNIRYNKESIYIGCTTSYLEAAKMLLRALQDLQKDTVLSDQLQRNLEYLQNAIASNSIIEPSKHNLMRKRRAAVSSSSSDAAAAAAAPISDSEEEFEDRFIEHAYVDTNQDDLNFAHFLNLDTEYTEHLQTPTFQATLPLTATTANRQEERIESDLPDVNNLFDLNLLSDDDFELPLPPIPNHNQVNSPFNLNGEAFQLPLPNFSSSPQLLNVEEPTLSSTPLQVNQPSPYSSPVLFAYSGNSSPLNANTYAAAAREFDDGQLLALSALFEIPWLTLDKKPVPPEVLLSKNTGIVIAATNNRELCFFIRAIINDQLFEKPIQCPPFWETEARKAIETACGQTNYAPGDMATMTRQLNFINVAKTWPISIVTPNTLFIESLFCSKYAATLERPSLFPPVAGPNSSSSNRSMNLRM